jgi:translation elongation factor EF-4
MENVFGYKDEEILKISSKTGENVPSVLLSIVEKTKW